MKQKGIGVGISKWATTKEMVEAINQVLYDESYAQNVQKLSDLMKLGMKQQPMENVIWWLEYLSQTKGASHLKLSSRHLNFIQYFSLDFILICCLLIYLTLKLFRNYRRKLKVD